MRISVQMRRWSVLEEGVRHVEGDSDRNEVIKGKLWEKTQKKKKKKAQMGIILYK